MELQLLRGDPERENVSFRCEAISSYLIPLSTLQKYPGPETTGDFRGKGRRVWGINQCLPVALVPPGANTEGNGMTIGFLESSAHQTSHQAPFAQGCSVLITQAQAALKTRGDLQTTHSLSYRTRRKLILPKNDWWPVGPRKEAFLLERENFIFQLNKYFPIFT